MSITKDLSVLNYEQIAAHFADSAVEIGKDFPTLMEPLLFAAKGVIALGKINSKIRFDIKHLEKWRRNVAWLTYAKGALMEKVAKLDTKVRDMKSDLHDEAIKSLSRRGIKISDEKIQMEVRKNEEFRKTDGQLSDLRAILSHVLDYCDQYKLIKDVLVQESTLTKHMMAP